MSNYVKLKDLKVFWEDCCISVECPYCGEEIILDSQNGEEVCGECGHVYQLTTSICEIVPKKKKKE